MEIGMIGLGRMGGNMTQRLLRGGHTIVVYDRSAEAVQQAVTHGATAAATLADVVNKLSAPRAIWVMVPSGEATETTLNELADHLSPGDILIDGGNSNYKDTVRQGTELAARGIHLIDAGTSGGVWGLSEGYSLMIGGNKPAIEHLTPIFQTLAPAPDRGWGHVGATGSGHFTKMIHNGIEYAMMQSYAEGFEILRAKKDFDLDLHQIAEIWRHGSVVRSWLLDLTASALGENPDLDGIKGWVADSGEGRWTVFEAIDQDVPAPTITLSLMMRFISRQDESFGAKLLAAMRNQFGGHAMKKD